MNIVLMVAGGLVLLVGLVRVGLRHRWRSALSFVPRRTRRLDLIHVTVILTGWLLASVALNALGSILSPPNGLLPDEWRGSGPMPSLWGVLSQSTAKLLAAGVLVVWVSVLMEGGVSGFGLTCRRLGRNITWGVLGYLAVWPLCMGCAQLIVWFTGEPPLHTVIQLLRSPRMPMWGTLTLWLSAVLISPVAEEVFFRGLLQTVVRGYSDRPWLAIVVASAAFGLVHAHQPQYVAPLLLLGLGLGYIYEHTGSLVGPIVLHILFNSRTMIMDLLVRQG